MPHNIFTSLTMQVHDYDLMTPHPAFGTKGSHHCFSLHEAQQHDLHTRIWRGYS